MKSPLYDTPELADQLRHRLAHVMWFGLAYRGTSVQHHSALASARIESHVALETELFPSTSEILFILGLLHKTARILSYCCGMLMAG